MKYIDYQNNAKSFRSLTGFSPEQFGELLPYFEESHNGYFSNYAMNGRTGTQVVSRGTAVFLELRHEWQVS
jgi:hypothetical protein